MPLVDYDYEYEYDFDSSRYNGRQKNGSVSRPQKTRKRVYDYNYVNDNNSKSFTKHETMYNMPTGIKSKRQGARNSSAFDIEKANTRAYKQNRQQVVSVEDEVQEVKANTKPSKADVYVRRINNFFLSIVGVLIIFGILYRSSMINEKFNMVEKAKKELATNHTVNEQLQAEIERETDLSYIENFAKYQLGMQKPQDSQIVYVNIQKQDRVLTPVVIEEDVEESWFDKLVEKISNLF